MNLSLLLVAAAISADTLPNAKEPLPVRKEPFPGTKPLEHPGDLAADMVAGIDLYLMDRIEKMQATATARWKPDYGSAAAHSKSVAAQRDRLKEILGVTDPRLPNTDLEIVSRPGRPTFIAENDRIRVYAVRWPVLPGLDGEGLYLEPKGKSVGSMVAIPDADVTAEAIAGLDAEIPAEKQWARAYAEAGYRVVVPTLINRRTELSGNEKTGRKTNIPHREFIYRMSYEMGRHLIGYEVQKVLAVVDGFAKELPVSKEGTPPGPIDVVGEGEGGLIAYSAGAIDPRIRTTAVAGYFADRRRLWEEPIYRNVWGRLLLGNDGDLAMLFGPGRRLLVLASDHPAVTEPPQLKGLGGGAPGKILTPTAIAVETEMRRAKIPEGIARVVSGEKGGGTPIDLLPHVMPGVRAANGPNLNVQPGGSAPADRHARQFRQLVDVVQKRWRDSESVRQSRFAKVDYSHPQKYAASIEPIRKFFSQEVIGELESASVPMNPRSRPIYDTERWTGYEVVLDVHANVFAYGILLMPKGMKPGEKRPVVVCQHGLEGRPTDVCNPKERTKYYNSFGAQLADRGYIVFAPQNPYIGRDAFRVLQRKANPLGLSLFSFIVRQHEVILDWLAALPQVDADRLAFYGLSYGGKTAMRVPAILPKYCLSICSGDFNEWIGKNVAVDLRMTYMYTMEYEMPEWDLGMTFNYAEMAYLIAPRPFMVERGHDDGVGIDEMVAYEFAKVRYTYANRLRLADRTEIEFFVGGHEINGKGTFDFLKKHLSYPK